MPWTTMPERPVIRRAAAAVAACALLAAGTHQALAAPDTNGQGFVDSWASCAAPNTAVVFGSTATSRVAVCKSTAGQYQYRGVRVRDGAKLAVDAKATGDNGFVADSDGNEYTVTPKSLRVSIGGKTVRDEPWQTYNGPQASSASSTTSASSTPTSSTSTATPTASTPTSTTPLPPPLPAEQGHT
jgi:hypothetical protein